MKMSKEKLLKCMDDMKAGQYEWNLYFLKIDRRKTNPYAIYKYTFRRSQYFMDYITTLADITKKYQIEKLEYVEEYNGTNAKTTCDKIDVHNQLIEEQWNYLCTSVRDAPREQVSGKYQGYILDGQPKNEQLPSVTIFKVCNPIISLNQRKKRVFSYNDDNELAPISDEVCRLYLNIDFAVIGNTLYTFNNKFEDIFNLEKTLSRLKESAIDQIIDTHAFGDDEMTKQFMNRYTASKTFLSLKEDRVNKLQSPDKRRDIASLLHLQFENDKIVINNQKEANYLIKYLCYKIFQDKETDYLIEVNNVVKENALAYV